MSRFTLGAVVGLLAFSHVVAEDWTGKKVKPKDDVKPGKRDGSGLVRGTDVVKKGTELTVKADDGTYLELDGKLGTIFKSEAILASNDPNALPSDGTTWKEGTLVYLRDPHDPPVLEIRSEDGSGSVKAKWDPQAQPTVRKDDDSGMVLVSDGTTEGWVKKKYFLTADDVPVWAERRLKANPKDLHALWVRGGVFCGERKYREAEKDFSTAIQIDPNQPEYHFRRAWACTRLGELDEALKDFNETLRLDPNFPEAVVRRGYCWMLKGEYAKADADLTEWQKDHPDDTAWLGYRAEVRFHLGDWEKSLADAETVLKADPKRTDMVRFKALSLGKLKKYQDAIDCFDKGIEDKPTDRLYAAFAHFLSTCPDEKFRDAVRAVSLMKLTLGTYERAQREIPAEYIEVFAAAYAEGGLFEEAIEKQTEALKQLKADKKTPAVELKRAEAALDLYKKNKPLRDE